MLRTWTFLLSKFLLNLYKHNFLTIFLNRICMKYIKSATRRMQSDIDHSREMQEPSLIEKVIKSGNDEKIACIMALDLILVGIDTVII